MPFEFESVRNLMQCVKCGAGLQQDQESLVCENEQCGQSYPIVDGIPQLLAEDADQ